MIVLPGEDRLDPSNRILTVISYSPGVERLGERRSYVIYMCIRGIGASNLIEFRPNGFLSRSSGVSNDVNLLLNINRRLFFRMGGHN